MGDLFTSERLGQLFYAYVVPFAIQLVIAALVFFLGRAVARAITRLVQRLMRKAKVDESLTRFLSGVLYIVLLMVVVIAALEQLGVQTTAAIAVLGAAGLAIGLALQGSLGNFAAGVLIIVFKPYRVDEVVKLAGVTGSVVEIGVFNTTLVTADAREIIIPNGNIISNTIENLSRQTNRRIDLVFGVGYGDDLRKAKTILEELVAADERVLKDPEAQVVVGELGESSVNLYCRPWVKTADWWTVKCDLLEKAKLAFDDAGISMPFPQRDVHVHQVAS